jgi:hypothetical protein
MLMGRAGAGARYAQLNTFDSTNITNVVVYNTASGGTGQALFGLTTSMVTVNRYDAGLPTDRIEIVIRNFPLAFYGPMLLANFSSRSFRELVPSQGLGAVS